MSAIFDSEDLPEIVVEEKSGNFTYVKVGSWSFCVEDDLDRTPEQLMEDARAFTAYAVYHEKLRAVQEQDQ